MLNEKEVEVLVVGGKRKGLQVFYDKAIERVVIEKSDKVIFIDDNKQNIKAAEAFGIIGIHFKSSAQLRNRLIQLHILAD